MIKKIKIAVIGYGFLGKWHVEKVLKLAQSENYVELVSIVEVSAEVRDRLKTQLPNVKIVGSLEEIIDQVDACIIVTPTSYHFNIAKSILQKGKHVFCEKPMTTTYLEAMELKRMAEEKKVVFQVGHSERFHLIWDRIKNSPLSELLREKSYARIERAAPFKGRATDVDVVRDLMIHDLDLLLFLFNEWPVTVEAVGYKIRTSNYDFVSCNLTFASGKKANIIAGRNHVEEVRKFDIQGTKGHLQVDMLNCKMKYFGPGHATVEIEEYQKRDHLLEEHRAFYQAILHSTNPPVTSLDGAKAVYLVDQVLASIEHNKIIHLEKL